MKRFPIVAFLFVFSVQFQFGCSRPPTPVSDSKASPTASPTASPSASTPTLTETEAEEPERLLATSAATSTHCGDNPPANPSKCNINQQFNVGCTLPWSGGQSHDIDQRCPNEGCAKRDSDIAQNRVKNNLCSTGTPVQISLTSVDKLQVAVDKLVQ